MKVLIHILRLLTGGLFIFSGLVKAIDPLGLAYKMQEFFEAWANDGYLPGLMKQLDHYVLGFSILMITLEVAVGVALLLGRWKKITLWLLLLLMLFFTFLTSYVLFSGKIRACGCFGDCIPLTPIQTFTKDIILLLFVLTLMFGSKYILPMLKPWPSTMVWSAATMSVLLLQFYVLKHLPVKDCLPYRVGNNIIELRKMPADAIPDKYEYQFVYEKGGEQKAFPVTGLPDSTWKFVERKQTLVQKGQNNIPQINDFSLTTADGIDSTEALLGQPGTYYLLFVKDLDDYPLDQQEDIALVKRLLKQHPVYIITSARDKVTQRFAGLAVPVFTCDATAIKTASRTKPALFEMNGPVVAHKWGWADFSDINPK